MNRKNVTMIDDLPYLDDLATNQILPPNSDINFSKYIRNTTFNPPSEAGMMNKQQQHQVVVPPPPQYQQQQQPIQQFELQQKEIQYEPEIENMDLLIRPISCVHVAHHASNCIVCSKLYTNDRTNYIIIIILLLTICVMLFKKILDSK